MKTLALDLKKDSFFIILTALFAGFISIFILNLPLKWAGSFIVGLLLFSLAPFLSNRHRYFQILFVLSIPFALLSHQFFVRRDYFGTPGISIGLVEVMLVVLYVFWLTSRPSLSRIKEVFFSKLSLAALVFILISSLSLLKAEDRTLAFFGLVTLVKAYLIFFYIANNLELKGVRYLLDFFLLALLLQEFLGIAQYFTGSSLGFGLLGETGELLKMSFGGKAFHRVGGTLVHPNQFANFLGLGLPLALSLLIITKRPLFYKAFYLSVFVLGLLVFILTFSRTGWIHITVSSLMILGLGIWKKKIKPEVVNYLIVGGLIAGIFLLFFSSNIFLRLFYSSPILVTARFDMARVAWRMITSSPWLGVGINNYMKALPKYDFIGVMPAPVHNLYLLIASEIGIFGLLVFLALIVFLYLNLRESLRSQENMVLATSIGIFGGLCGFLAAGLSDFSYILPSTNILFWFFAGLTLALSGMVLREEKSRK